MTEEIRDIIRHSLGLGQGKRPYRSYYCSPETPALAEAVENGWMTGPRQSGWSPTPYWFVTEAGAAAVGSHLPEEST